MTTRTENGILIGLATSLKCNVYITLFALIVFHSAPVSTQNGGKVVPRIAIIVPNNNSPFSKNQIEPAVQIATEKIERSPDFLFDRIEIQYLDSNCPTRYEHTGLELAAIELIKAEKCDCFIGPTEDFGLSNVARISSYENFPVISPGGLDLNFGVNKSNHPLYKTLVRVGATTNTLNLVLGTLLLHFRFGKIKVLSQKHGSVIDICQRFYNGLDYMLNFYKGLEFDIYQYPRGIDYADLLQTEVGNDFGGIRFSFVSCMSFLKLTLGNYNQCED